MNPEPQIKFSRDDLIMVPVTQIQPDPNNRNKHSEEQIDRLCELIRYQGFRQPLIVSKVTGLLIVGHARLQAAQKIGLKEVPVLFQEFDTRDQEYAFGVSDNAIACWAELDFSGINSDLGDLGPHLNIDLLGIKDFVLEPADKSPEHHKQPNSKSHMCPACGYKF